MHLRVALSIEPLHHSDREKKNAECSVIKEDIENCGTRLTVKLCLFVCFKEEDIENCGTRLTVKICLLI